MPSSLFSLPVSTWQSTRTVGQSSQSAYATRKRKRRSRHDLDEDHPTTTGNDLSSEDDNLSSPTSRDGTETSRPQQILTPDDIYQYRVAGQPLKQNLPANNFPHSTGRRRREKRVTFHPEEDDGLTSQHGTRPTVTLRQQHLAVITAILHRCILERDFDRASRALGLMLRDEVYGHAIDIRSQGRWGIGAEILWRKGQGQHQEDQSSVITRSGFELARRYYERLIVQHPFSKTASHVYDERDFNMALLGLWIFVAHQDGKMTREQDNGPDGDEDGQAELETHLQRELVEAREIARRLDDLMISPLYSQHVEFIRLRAMVALWLSDLSREYDYVADNLGDRDGSMNLDDDDDGDDDDDNNAIDSALAAGVSGVDLNNGSSGRRKPRQNTEAAESQRKAAELLDVLKVRLGYADDYDDD